MKKLIQTSLAPFGVKISRIPRNQRRGNAAPVTVRVGNYNILMSGASLLPDIFSVNPNYSSELGRLAAVTRKKYPDLCVLDVGANFGDSVAIVKSSVEIPVACIEGDEQCFALLKENLKQFKDVTAHQLYLGEVSEAVPAVMEKKGWNTTIIPQPQGSPDTIRLTSLDDYLSTQNDLGKYKLLKIDTEGFDCRIIKGGLKYIDKISPVITLEYNRDNMNRINEKGLDTLFRLGDLGYSTVLFYDSQGRFILSERLENRDLITDLHEYANGRDGAIYYYDLCLFHRRDEDIASEFVRLERARLKA